MADSTDYENLIRQDPIAARFGPHGLMTDRALTPEGSASFLADAVRRAGLSAGVPDDVQQTFERVRELFRYGMFRYAFFTFADHAAWTIPETALGVRFVERYDGKVPFVRRDEVVVVEADRYRTIAAALGPKGPYPHRGGWRLRGHEGVGNVRSFNGSYRALLEWAYSERLLAPWLDGRWDRLSGGIVHAITTQMRRPTSTQPFVVPRGWTALDGAAREAWFDEFRDASAVPDNWAEMMHEDRAAWLDDYRRIIWERQEIDVLVDLRNLVAHADAGTLLMPSQAAEAIFGVAGFIKGLWPESAQAR